MPNSSLQLDPMTGLYFDPADSSGRLYDSAGKQVTDLSSMGPDLSGPWGHPQLNPATQGTSQYGTLQNPYLPNYVNIGGEPVVSGEYSQAEGVAKYNREQKHLDDDQFALGNPASVAAIPMLAAGLATAGAGAAGSSSSSGALQPVTLPSSATYLSPVAAEGGAGAGAAVGPPSSLAGSAESMAPAESGSNSSGFLKRLFHMGGNQLGQQRSGYRYQNPAVADYAQQQQAAEMLAEALSKKQPVDPIVRGGPVPVGRY